MISIRSVALCSPSAVSALTVENPDSMPVNTPRLSTSPYRLPRVTLHSMSSPVALDGEKITCSCIDSPACTALRLALMVMPVVSTVLPVTSSTRLLLLLLLPLSLDAL